MPSFRTFRGLKIRVGKFEKGVISLKEGDKIRISVSHELGRPGWIPTDFEPLPGSVAKGSRILLDDGLIELRVVGVKGSDVDCEIVYGGDLKDRKGMNIPGAHLPVAAMTEKDLKDLQFGLENNVDYVALSFVRKGEDMRRLRGW